MPELPELSVEMEAQAEAAMKELAKRNEGEGMDPDLFEVLL